MQSKTFIRRLQRLISRHDCPDNIISDNANNFIAQEMSVLHSVHLFFYKQLGLGLSPQHCLYFQGFWDSTFLNDCLVV